MARLVSLILLAFAANGPLAAEAETKWPGWRGPRGDGSSLDAEVPVAWSLPRDLRWKTPIPGEGHASPIIWEDAILVVSALPDTGERVLMRIDRQSGDLRWQIPVLQAPLERIHHLNSHASSTPATDGEQIYVSFLDGDKMFIAAYDFKGKPQWAVHPGVFSSIHGYCSSPVLWENLVIVNGDHDGDAYIVALDRKTGQTVWKTARPNKTRSYCTPIIRRIEGRDQLIFSGSKCVTSLDPETGKQHWIIDGPTEQFVASLVYNGEHLFMTCGFPERHMLAIDPRGSGNVTDSHVVWRTDKQCAYVPSPLAMDDYFLVVADSGRASCFDAKTGRRHWLEKLGREHSASLISARGHAFFTANSGTITAIKPGEQLEIVARNELGEEIRASPAISAGCWFIRGVDHLYCIGGSDSR